MAPFLNKYTKVQKLNELLLLTSYSRLSTYRSRHVTLDSPRALTLDNCRVNKSLSIINKSLFKHGKIHQEYKN